MKCHLLFAYVGATIVAVSIAFAQEAQPQPTVADMQAALSEANMQASINANRAQTFAANLAHANAEIARLKIELDEARKRAGPVDKMKDQPKEGSQP